MVVSVILFHEHEAKRLARWDGNAGFGTLGLFKAMERIRRTGQPSTSLFYDPAVDFVGAIGDFDKFVNTFPNEGAVRVVSTYLDMVLRSLFDRHIVIRS